MRRGRAIFWSISGATIVAGFGYVGWLAYAGRDSGKLDADSTIARSFEDGRAKADVPPEPWVPSRAWWKQVTIDAFDKAAGDKSWPSARRAVVAFGADLSGNPSRTSDEPEDAVDAAATAVEDFGCEDPLVRWVLGRYRTVDTASARDDPRAQVGVVRRQVIAAADELRREGTPYAPFLRCLALVEAAGAVVRGPAYLTTVPEDRAAEYAAAAAALFPLVAADLQTDPHALLRLADAVGDLSRDLRRDRVAGVEPLAVALEKAGHKRSVVLAVRGDGLVSYAWDARGTGSAGTVNEKGWKGFAERLAMARAALAEAWELDHGNSEAASRMITVCMGEGADAAEVDRWFKRAIEADPANFNAADRKLLLLQPKWGGSTAAMILFGRELARASVDPRAVRLPVTLVDAHWTLARYAGGGNPDPSYFADNPDLWDDVSRVYEKYLAAAPGSRFHRTRYALIAAWAGHWDVAGAQFDKLGERFSRSVVSGGVVKALQAQAKRKGKAVVAGGTPNGNGDAAREGAAAPAAPARKRVDDGL